MKFELVKEFRGYPDGRVNTWIHGQKRVEERDFNPTRCHTDPRKRGPPPPTHPPHIDTTLTTQKRTITIDSFHITWWPWKPVQLDGHLDWLHFDTCGFLNNYTCTCIRNWHDFFKFRVSKCNQSKWPSNCIGFYGHHVMWNSSIVNHHNINDGSTNSLFPDKLFKLRAV